MVKEVLVEWDLKRETVGLVFDTTSSNTGAEHGACRQLEMWLETTNLCSLIVRLSPFLYLLKNVHFSR